MQPLRNDTSGYELLPTTPQRPTVISFLICADRIIIIIIIIIINIIIIIIINVPLALHQLVVFVFDLINACTDHIRHTREPIFTHTSSTQERPFAWRVKMIKLEISKIKSQNG